MTTMYQPTTSWSEIRGGKPQVLSQAIEQQVETLFADAPEPRRSRCRKVYVQAKIRAREQLGKPVPDKLHVLVARLTHEAQKAQEQVAETAEQSHAEPAK